MSIVSVKRNGFTIVELLIVIVVIGILAAITIVSFNGVQQKARNAQVVSGVQAYNKAILQYAAVNSAYPAATGCLGANYQTNQCWLGDQGTQVVNATLDSSLAEFIGSKPTIATDRFSIGIGNNMRAGALYRPSPVTIIYYLQGAGQACGLSGASGGTEGGVVTQCILTLPPL